jgi:hypothetical protein
LANHTEHHTTAELIKAMKVRGTVEAGVGMKVNRIRQSM